MYHDLGNTNFSFVSRRNVYDKQRNCSILLRALQHFNIDAELKGRNDIVLGPTKISGHAYKYSMHNALHHGTLLREVDMDTLKAVLSPSKAKLQSKGVASVEARISNLASQFPQLTHESFCEAVEHEFEKAYPGAQVEREMMTEETMRRPAVVREQEQLLGSWEWRFGESPQFSINITHRFEWGVCDLYVDYQKGQVTRSKLYSDALSPDLVAALEQGVDAQLSPETAKALLVDSPEMHPQVDEFFNWVRHEIMN